MSFGYSIGDFILLTTLAYKTVQNARSACGAHDSLTREVGSLHIVLERLAIEVSKPDSILNRSEDHRRRELATLAKDCRQVLNVLSQILEKYNRLSDEKKSVTKLWQKVRFGNGEMQDLGKIRSEVATYTQALTLFLNLLSIGTLGKMEGYMDSHGDDLRDIKEALHWVTASMQADSHGEKSILTSYTEDDKAVWKDFRRELIKEGFSSRLLDKHRRTIKRYVMELGERGVLDDIAQEEPELTRDITPASVASSSRSPNEIAFQEETDEGSEVSFRNVTPTMNLEEGSESDETTLKDAQPSDLSDLAPNDGGGLSISSPQSATNIRSIPSIPPAGLPDNDVEHEDEFSDSNSDSNYETEGSRHEVLQPIPIHNQFQPLKSSRETQGPQNQSCAKATTSPGVLASESQGDDELEDEDDSTSGGDSSDSIRDGLDFPIPATANSDDQRTASHDSKAKPRSTNSSSLAAIRSENSNFAYVEEVEDEDLLPGAHPNCGTISEEDEPSETSLQKCGISLENPSHPSNNTLILCLPEDSLRESLDEDLQPFDEENFADDSSSASDEESTKRSRLKNGRCADASRNSPPWSRTDARSNYRDEQNDETLKRYRSEKINPIITTIFDTEICLNGRIGNVVHFADFNFSSGPDEFPNRGSSAGGNNTTKRLKGEQKEVFEEWLQLWRLAHPPQEDFQKTNGRSGSAGDFASKIVRRRDTFYPLFGRPRAVWDSASEREERRVRLKLRRKYIKKTRDAVSSRPPRLAFESKSSVVEEGFSGPLTRKTPLYPFLKPHSWKRYGSPLPTHRGDSCSSAPEDDPVKEQVPVISGRKGRQDGQELPEWRLTETHLKLLHNERLLQRQFKHQRHHMKREKDRKRVIQCSGSESDPSSP